MEARVSEILENILGLMALEGSFEVVEEEEFVKVTIEAQDPGRLIGYHGETLDALQHLVNLIVGRGQKEEEKFKRVVVDVSGWRQNKEQDIARQTESWIKQVQESKQEMELEPMPAWQRRVIHSIVSETEGITSESRGEGRDRHIVILPEAKHKE